MECLIGSLKPHRITQWMELLHEQQKWKDLWEPLGDSNGFKSALLVIGHLMAQQDPPSPGEFRGTASEKQLWDLKQALTKNNLVHQIMEDLWIDLPTLAACVSSEALLVMAVNLIQGVHPHILKPGFKKFLQMNLNIPANATPTPELCKHVSDTACCYVELVNEVKHLDLDAGHWHELWQEGDAVGLCIILHYVKHEKRSRLQQLGRIHNINACINSNIMRIRDGLAGSPGLVVEVTRLWATRPDVAGNLDGNTLQLLISEFKGDESGARQCLESICQVLPETWVVDISNAEPPTTQLYNCVQTYIVALTGREARPQMSSGSRQKTGSGKQSSSSKSKSKMGHKQLQIQVPGTPGSLVSGSPQTPVFSPHTPVFSPHTPGFSPRIMVPNSPQVMMPTTPGFLGPSSPLTPMQFSHHYVGAPTSPHMLLASSPQTPSHMMNQHHQLQLPSSPQMRVDASPRTPSHMMNQHHHHLPSSPQMLPAPGPQTSSQMWVDASPRTPSYMTSKRHGRTQHMFMPAISPQPSGQMLLPESPNFMGACSPQTPGGFGVQPFILPASPEASLPNLPTTPRHGSALGRHPHELQDELNDTPWSFAGLCL